MVSWGDFDHAIIGRLYISESRFECGGHFSEKQFWLASVPAQASLLLEDKVGPVLFVQMDQLSSVYKKHLATSQVC